jgi:aminoglycoside phosphotransferase (APT) family kinase protein
MSALPDDFAVALDRLASLGWRPEQIEWVKRPSQGERNQVYLLRHAGESAVIRLPLARSKAADRSAREIHNLNAAAAAGVTPAPLLADPKDGLLLLPYLQGEHPKPGIVTLDAAVRMGRCLRILHRDTATFRSGTDILRRIRRRMAGVAAEADDARRHAAGLPSVVSAMEPVVATLKRTVPLPVPCHGDLVLGNIIDDGVRVHFIDWETSTAGDPHQDVANLCLRARLEGAPRAALLGAYFDGDSERSLHQATARIRLWEPACALDKALTYWRNGVRSGDVDPRVASWTQRCSALLAAPGMRAAHLVLDLETADL